MVLSIPARLVHAAQNEKKSHTKVRLNRFPKLCTSETKHNPSLKHVWFIPISFSITFL